PGRGIAGRDFSRIGKAGFQSRSGLTIDDRDLVSSLVQIIGGGDPDDTCAQHNDLHWFVSRGPALPPCRGSAILMDTMETPTEPRQYLVAYGAGDLRQVVDGLVRPDEFDKI